MNRKHLDTWMCVALRIAAQSPCPRAKYGTVLIDPVHNVIISSGYNGTPRGFSGALCGGACCDRDRLGIKSGTETQIGCVHSEMNALCNSARVGHATIGAWAIVTGEPCLMCAKLLYQAGIVKVFLLEGGYTTTIGVEFLISMGVEIVNVTGSDSGGYVDSYWLSTGEDPEEKSVLHSCDNPSCVNPVHLRAGTQLENMQDRKIRHRQPDFNGESNPNSKLTVQEWEEIKSLRLAGYSLEELSAMFEVCKSQISRICLRNIGV